LLLSLVNAQLRVQLETRAVTDELTGVLTRRALREQADDRIQEARRGRKAVAVLMLDLDHFKAINDNHGHAVGDLVLRHSAACLRDALRADALLARYGGEEFVALVPVEDLRAARLVAERLRHSVQHAPWSELTHTPAVVSISVGVTLMVDKEPLDSALQRADEALYRAKREGRNRVQVGLSAA
jgi:diguanylate cyclase (GGDEF)-like protein